MFFDTKYTSMFGSITDFEQLANHASYKMYSPDAMGSFFTTLSYYLKFGIIPTSIDQVNVTFAREFERIASVFEDDSKTFFKNSTNSMLLAFSEESTGTNVTSLQVRNFAVYNKLVYYTDIATIKSSLIGKKRSQAGSIVEFLSSSAFWEQQDANTYVLPARRSVLKKYAATNPLYRQLLEGIQSTQIKTVTWKCGYNAINNAAHLIQQNFKVSTKNVNTKWLKRRK
jgi:hypothetical protein